MSPKLISFAVSFVLFASINASAEKPDCNDDVWFGVTSKETTNEGCRKALEKFSKTCQAGTYGTTVSLKSEAYEELSCIKRILVKELDVRLLSLKHSDAVKFRNEMKMQKEFNSAVSEACDAYNSCDGTMYQVSLVDCQVRIHQWRLSQTIQINKSSLKLSENSPRASKKIKTIKHVSTFADLLCKMPKEIFANGIVPVDCQKKTIAEFARSVGDDCHQEF